MTPFLAGRMFLGLEAGGGGRHPAAARWTGLDADTQHHVLVARLAARRGLDFVALPGDPDDGDGTGTLDPVRLAALIAPVVPAIGLLPTVAVTEGRAHPAGTLADLDLVSSARAGWEPAAPVTGTALAALAEQWEQSAVSDRPRPLVVLRADGLDALPVAARWADIVRISAPDPDAARSHRERIRTAVADAGRHPDDVLVLLDVEIHIADDAHTARTDVDTLDRLAGTPLPATSVRVLGPARSAADLIERAVRLGAVDGVTLVPLVLPVDARRVSDELVPQLAGRGLFRPGPSGASLRDRFGLTRGTTRLEVTAA